MRKIVCAISLASALIFALAVHAAAPVSFAGTWTLDKSKSQGLSQRMQGADSVSWVITQTDKEITIEEKVQGGGGPGGGGPPAAGGAPGGGGRGPGMGGPRTYSLGGTETNGEMGPAKFVRKASWSGDGKTLELTQKTTFQRQDGSESTSNSSDKLTLSGDGKTLTVTRHSEGGRGPQDSTLVFNK
ncbi:MAG: hypothetical protein C5B55_05730 [Blastocatellia bacterium]|nr:MAG: hypothetical protein C5B55_05730 [Blastocatellia bacterium]